MKAFKFSSIVLGLVLLVLFFGCGGSSSGSEKKVIISKNELVLNEKAKFINDKDTKFIEEVKGVAFGEGEVKISDPKIVKDWKKDEIKILPVSANIPTGLALKIVSVDTTASGAIVKYTTPAIDEIFKNSSISINKKISTKMVKSVHMQKGINVKFNTKNSKTNRVAEWFPDGGTDFNKSHTPIHDNVIDSINMSFDSLIYRDNENGELLQMSGSINIKDMQVSYDFEQTGTIYPELKSNFNVTYNSETNLKIDLKIDKKASLVDYTPERFECGGFSFDKQGDNYAIKIAGADFGKHDTCLGSVSLELSEVPIKASVGGDTLSDAPVSLRLFFIVGADMKIKIASTVELSKSQYTDTGVSIDTNANKNKKLKVWNNEYVSKTDHSKPKWKKNIYGEMSGKITAYDGVALAVDILGIYPVIARAYAGPKLTGKAKAGFSDDLGLNACYDVELGLDYGFTSSVYLSLDLEYDPLLWKKVEFHGKFEYPYEINGYEKMYSYNSCQADGFHIKFKKTPVVLEDFNISNIEVTNSLHQVIIPQKISYNLYKDNIFVKSSDNLTELMTDSSEDDDYKIEVIVLIDEKRAIKASVSHPYSTVIDNIPPTANAGADQNITVGSVVTLNGTGTDKDGTIVKYEWKEGNTVLAETATFTKSDFTVGVHTLTFTVTDDKNATGIDNMLLRVSDKTNENNQTWNRTIGGSDSESFYDVVIDSNGNSYVVGSTNSNDGDIVGSHGSLDALIVKYDNAGNMLWSKLFGGSGDDRFESIEIDGDKNLCVVGFSSSSDGDIIDAHGNYDAVIVKYDSNGNKLWSKAVGGSNADLFYGVAVDGNNNLYAAGYTKSTDGDITDDISGHTDAMIIKFDSNGNQLWDKTIGGNDADHLYDIVVGNDNALYAVGETELPSQPFVVGVLYDAMIVKIDMNGNVLWNKSINDGGSPRHNKFDGIAVDSENNAYAVSSASRSSGDITDGNNGENDALIMKFDSGGNKLWDRTIGGSNHDSFKQVVTDRNGEVYAVGYTDSSDYDITDKTNGGHDALLVKLNSDGNLLWNKTIGGGGSDEFESIISDKNGSIWMVGHSSSSNGDITDGNNGKSDAFIVKIQDNQVTSTSKVLKTGQTTSYTSYDDGYYQSGAERSYTRANDIVTDNTTGLQWQDDEAAKTVKKQWITTENYNAGNYSDTSGNTATTYCSNLVLGGYSDWRLPTRAELVSLGDYGRVNPAIDPIFQNVASYYYWSSTTNAGSSDDTWTVYFNNGRQRSYSKYNNNYVRCVRAGE